ncbi:MAG: hypothetical protein JW874_14500 [Spirochaetales bacterium]|nr:hypothetical protein [Spirochaetales bacterium]
MKKTLILILAAGVLFSCLDPDQIAHVQSEVWLAGLDYDDDDAPLRLNAAAVCLEADTDPAVNLAKVLDFVDTIVSEHPDVRLIVFGEIEFLTLGLIGQGGRGHFSLEDTAYRNILPAAAGLL